MTDDDLDKPTSEKFRSYAPNLANLYIMASDHTLWHAGQFSVIRRKLGKKVLM